MSNTLHQLADALARGLLHVTAKLLDGDTAERSLARFVRELLALELRGYRGVDREAGLLDALRGALDDAGAPKAETLLVRWLPEQLVRRLREGDLERVGRAIAWAVVNIARGAPAPSALTVAQLDWPPERKDDLATLLVSLRARLVRLEAWRAPLDYAAATPLTQGE